MRPSLWCIPLLAVGASAWALPDLDGLFRATWQTSPAAHLADQALRQASLTREYTHRQRWPSVSVDSVNGGSPPVVSAQGSEPRTSVTGAVALTVAQNLPGGGRLTLAATTTQTEVRERDTPGAVWADPVPTVSLGWTQPLGATSPVEVAAWTYRLEVLSQLVTARDSVFAMVKAAADLDIARQTLVWRRSLEAAATTEVDEASELVAVGKGSVMDLWRAQRKASAARWERIQVETTLLVASHAWRRYADTDLPAVDDEALAALSLDREPDPELVALEARLATARKALEHLGTQAERSALAPSVKVALSTAKPTADGWTWEGLVGVSVGTDWWILDPLVQGKQAAADRRWDLLVATSRDDEASQRAGWNEELATVRDALDQLGVGLERMAKIGEELRSLSLRHIVPRSESLTAEAEMLSMALDRRKLGWQAAQLAYQLSPPRWLLELR